MSVPQLGCLALQASPAFSELNKNLSSQAPKASLEQNHESGRFVEVVHIHLKHLDRIAAGIAVLSLLPSRNRWLPVLGTER